MAEIDCSRVDCRRLDSAFMNGVSDDDLRRLGIAPGSPRARRLQEGLEALFRHCCVQRLEPPPPPEGPVTAGAVPIPWNPAAMGELPASWIGLWAVVLLLAAYLARQANLRACPLTRSYRHWDPFDPRFLKLECLYRCPNGRSFSIFTPWHTAPICPPAIILPS
jgi:hypothetical protein